MNIDKEIMDIEGEANEIIDAANAQAESINAGFKEQREKIISMINMRYQNEKANMEKLLSVKGETEKIKIEEEMKKVIHSMEQKSQDVIEQYADVITDELMPRK